MNRLLVRDLQSVARLGYMILYCGFMPYKHKAGKAWWQA